MCPQARSGELAPVGLCALWRQRLRWAIGWDEVTFKHSGDIWRSEQTCFRKFGTSYICWNRWVLQVIGLIAGFVTPVLGLMHSLFPNQPDSQITQFVQRFSLYFFIILILLALTEATLQTHHRGCQSWIQVIFVVIFLLLGPLYVIFQALLIVTSMFKIATGTVGGWYVTTRSKATDTQPEKHFEIAGDVESQVIPAHSGDESEGVEAGSMAHGGSGGVQPDAIVQDHTEAVVVKDPTVCVQQDEVDLQESTRCTRSAQ